MPYKNKWRQMEPNSNTSCPNTRNIIIMGVNNIEKKALFFNPACKQWSCPYCGEVNKQYWVYQAQRGSMLLLSEGQMMQFVTLTGRGYFTPTTSIYFFRQNWPKMRKKLHRLTDKWADVTGTKFAYFLIPERHKSGLLHAHMLVTTFMDSKKWYKNEAHKCGFGYMADVQSVDSSAAAAGYVTKYLTKDAGGIEWPKGFMRTRHSQNWPITKPAIDELWQYQTIGERDKFIELGALIDMGYHVTDKTGEGEK